MMLLAPRTTRWTAALTQPIRPSAALTRRHNSRHPRGAHFGFCDGSVRLVSESADSSIIRWLAGRSDGIAVGEDM